MRVRRAGTRLRELPLAVRIGVLSGLVVLVLGAVLHAALRDRMADRARETAVASAEFVSRVAVQPVLRGTDLRAPVLPMTQESRLDDVVREALEDELLRRVKVFDLDGRIVWSDDEGQVGDVVPPGSSAVRAMRAGVVRAELADVRHGNHAGESELGRMLEVFVPLELDAAPGVDGVVEVYLPYGPVDRALAEDGRALLLMVVGGLGVFWLVLFRIVVRASRRLEDELAQNAHQALHDGLTGLPNRTLLFDRAERAVAAGRRSGAATAVLLLDLDRFKEVNDTLGHRNGDLLLCEVAGRFAAALRHADTLARLGGDEFAVLLPVVDGPEGAREVAERLGACLREPVLVGGLAVAAGVSIGIALSPADGDTPELLLQRADVAMYAAKGSHSGVALYAADRDTYSPERLALLGELRRAIADDDLVLHYQPKSDVRTGELTGVEALVRWQHAERGLVPPDVFVPLAEQSGLVDELTAWVLGTALRTTAAWRAQGVDLPVSVNVSVRNLLDPAFPDKVAASLARHGGRLVLEITETSLMADPDTALDVLRRLKALGVVLSIDDYGSGYSSLAYLQQLPVDELKIDRVFVRNLADDARDQAIVRSTVELGRNLGLRVVAEGVEDLAAWEALADLRCDELQGYHVCRPLPADRLLAWLQTHVPAPPHAVV